MPDKPNKAVIDLKGSALVFTPEGDTAVYKVELSIVAAGGDYIGIQRFAHGVWAAHDLLRSEHRHMMGWVEFNADRLAHEEYQWWRVRLAEATGTQVDRIGRLLDAIMDKFDVSQGAVADRVGLNRATVSEYRQGRGKGTGVTLELALEALLARSIFDAPEGGQQ